MQIMRKILGTLTILFILYLGFFGWDKYNIEPFILNWLKSWNTEQIKEKSEKIVEIIAE